MTIGVLALQGDFAAHQSALGQLGVVSAQVRTAADLDRIEGLIAPGGESTTMLKLLHEEGLIEPLKRFAARKSFFGTCAGCILGASKVTAPEQPSFGFLDLTVERNAYGRQVDSAIRRLTPEPSFVARTAPGELEAVFIRAPIIRSVGSGVTVLLREGDRPVLVEQGRHMAATFHPELTADLRVHRIFLEKLRQAAA